MGGGTVLTDKRLSLYASWFESRFSQFPEVKNFILSADGLNLKGAEISSSEELLALKECRAEIDALLSKCLKYAEKEFFDEESSKKRAEKYEITLTALLKELQTIETLALDAAENARSAIIKEKMGHLQAAGREDALKKLEAANKTISETSSGELTSFLFPDTDGWEAEISAKTPEPFLRQLEFLARFHKSLAEAASNNFQILSKVQLSKADTLINGREILH